MPFEAGPVQRPPFSVINFLYIAPQNLRLAQIHFHARLLELKAQIGEEEEKFKRIVAEIDEIRNGAKQKQPNPAKVEEVRQAEEVEKIENVTIQEESQPESTPLPELSEDDASADTELQVAEENTEKEPEKPVSSPDVPSPQGIDIDALLVPDPDEDTPMSDGCERELQPVEPSEAQRPELQKSSTDTNHQLITELQQNTTGDDDARASPSIPMDVDGSPKPSAESPKQETASPKHEQPQDTAQATEPTPDPNATEDEALSSGDEPLHVQRNRRGTRRGRPSVSGNRPTRNRRMRTADPVPSDVDMPEHDAKEDTESPAAEVQSSKRQGKRRASFADDETRDKKRQRDESEPVEEEESAATSSSKSRRRGDQTAAKKFQNVIGMLHAQISQHRNGTIFHNPIKDSEAPDYHEIVKRPMDLKTIKARIKDGAISNSLEFQRDIYQMFANAMMYNRPGSDVYVMTEDMMLDCEGYIQTFRQTEGFVRGSQR
ncbi:brd8 protein [Moniliophthora roreri MCA 2997]|uniref:Brd8 protein n=1 Tax=Moniliophthora roreri (strain MCA 2997) TaxID=1381753 RepID=V2XQM2_MONRO|nr:brd8 protein [Moniliophthora roreri MCA 2997]